MLRARSNFLLGAAALGGLALSIDPAAAQSAQTEKLHIEATIGEVCTVTSANLDFGPYEGATLSKSGSIDISCLAPTTLQVALDGGLGPHNGNGQRTMLNGSDELLYALFVDAPNGGDPWDTGEAVETTISGTGSVPVHGVVAGFQTGLAPGVYSDDVTITLSF